MLNHALYENWIEADKAIEMMVAEMPLTFQRGEWASPKRGGLMVLKKRLVAWWSDADSEPLKLRDLHNILDGN